MKTTKVPQPKKLKKIFWIVDGFVKQEIKKDDPVPESVAHWLKNKMAKDTHRLGKLVVVDCDADPQKFENRQLKLKL